MSNEVFVLALNKAIPVEDSDGVLTRRGMDIAHEYAVQIVDRGYRDVSLERLHPELIGLFYDIRNDLDFAKEHAIPFPLGV